MTRFIIISGGVVSGVGKGVITASIGLLLKEMGFAVTCIKIDPYLNVDAGTLSPYEHGEVFVLEDGSEVDLDLGNYERFLGIHLTKDNNITTGKVFGQIIQREREGHYLGKTVQFLPDATNFVQEWILRVAKTPLKLSDNSTSNSSPEKMPDFCLIELGGTPGDIESMLFFESLRQLQFAKTPKNFLHLHVTLIPELSFSKEQKSKPAQQSFLNLRKVGLNPNIVFCRSRTLINSSIRRKVSLYAMVRPESVFCVPDVQNTFQVPLMLKELNVHSSILSHFELGGRDAPAIQLCHEILKFEHNRNEFPLVKIAFIGKYVKGSDCYLSLLQALKSSARKARVQLEIEWVDAENLTENIELCQGILIPGGFGGRGIEGKIAASKIARKKNIPFLGICLGMQIAAIEFGRNVMGWDKANSIEFDKACDKKVTVIMPESDKAEMGGSMRLGSKAMRISANTKLSEIYGGQNIVEERYRHRYEINPQYVENFEKNGFLFSGKDLSGKRMSGFEYGKNDFYMGVQFHPEYKSYPGKPAPIIMAFIEAVSRKCGEVNNRVSNNVSVNGKRKKNEI